MRGGGETAHIHARARRKVNAVRVAQKHLAVGVDLPEYLAGVSVKHAVEQHAAAVRLRDVDRGVGPYVEALPVDDGLIGRLANRHAGCSGGLCLVDGYRPGSHLPACGQLVNQRWSDQRRGGQRPASARNAPGQQCRGSDQAHGAFFATGADVLCHRHPGVECFAINKFVAAIHESERQ